MASKKEKPVQNTKKQKSASGGNNLKRTSSQHSDDKGEQKQKLQAILLADSFNNNFRPISHECPKVLLPLVNIPMLDYTIEFLSLNGVEEVSTILFLISPISFLRL
jgi:translation initiation factor eIF-2B subunit epsilon